ncbi:hypothetical protein TNCV_2215801 [Trichonephila clavipes]|nr:hypothetical protein TNCV_2215801 [Trichonephila clavipes]
MLKKRRVTNPLGKSLDYQFGLFTTNPSEEENRDIQINLLDICSRSFLARIDSRRGNKPETTQSHPQHELAKKQSKGFSGMVSFCVKGGLKDAKKLAARIKVFILAVSLGGPESLMDVT